MATALLILHMIASAVLAWFGVRALFHMKRRTSHTRRAAFVALTFGAGVSFIEAVGHHPPLLSAPVIALGACLLLACGARGAQA